MTAPSKATGGQSPASPALSAPSAQVEVTMAAFDRSASEPDPLNDANPWTVSAHAHLEALLRGWLAETGQPVPDDVVRVNLPSSGLSLFAPVRHRSPTGWHRFGPVTLLAADGRPIGSADPVTAAALVATEAARRTDAAPGRGEVPPDEIADLVERTAESVRRVSVFVADRRDNPDPTADGFLAAEQALVLGHLRHPAPKSRDGLSTAEAAAYSPELRGSFQLHWFAAEPDVVSQDAVFQEPSYGGLSTAELMASLPGAPKIGADRILLPAHPWQARDLLYRPRIAALIASGALTALGPAGEPWWPTSSLRTVYRPDQSVQLKLSLGLRITNSRRESTRTELRRGAEINRLLAAGYAAKTERAFPCFRIVRDPGWIAVDEPLRQDGPEVTGLDVAVRENPSDLVTESGELRCLAGLVAPRPGHRTSRLGELAAAAPGGPTRWVADYVDRVLVPMLHLYATTGIGLEAHQQNTLVRIASDGSVSGGAYRDNQGYYLDSDFLPAVLKTLDLAESTLAVVDGRIVDERLTYYLLHNQMLAVIGCLAIDGLAKESDLLRVLVDRLTAALPMLADATTEGDQLASYWLTAGQLPYKGNLLTRLHGIDEVLAPLDAQSVYLRVPNPLRTVRR